MVTWSSKIITIIVGRSIGIDETAMSVWDLSYQICSIVSVFASGCVVLTLILYKSMRNKLFMRIIANISLADLLGNIPYTTLYRPSNGAPWCSIQGFLNLYSYPCSWLWTTALVVFLYDLSVDRKVRITFRTAFYICWGIPIPLTLLYFAFVPHGAFERHEDSSKSFCTYGGNQAFVWHMISYYGLFFCCVIYMAFLYVYIRRAFIQERHNIAQSQQCRDSAVSTSSNATLSSMKLTSDSLMLNPLLMIILWTPHIIGVIMSISLDDTSASLSFMNVAIDLKIMHGFSTAVLFFCKSYGARMLWYRLFLCKYSFKQSLVDDPEIDYDQEERNTENSISDYRISDYAIGRDTSPSMSNSILAITNPMGSRFANEQL